MHYRPQKRMASETRLTMCLSLIIFFFFLSSERLFMLCSGFLTELRKDSVAIITSWWYFICSCLFAFSWSLRQFMKGLLTKTPLSFLQCIGIIKAQCLQNTLSTEGPSMGTHRSIVTETLFGTDEEIALETCSLIDGTKGLLIKWYFWPTGSLFAEEPNSSEVVEIFPMLFTSCCFTGSMWYLVRLPSVFAGTGACAQLLR